MKIINSSFQYSSQNLNKIKELKDIYKKYKVKSKYDLEIIRDLTHTYPNDNSFSKNYKKLYTMDVSVQFRFQCNFEPNWK